MKRERIRWNELYYHSAGGRANVFIPIQKSDRFGQGWVDGYNLGESDAVSVDRKALVPFDSSNPEHAKLVTLDKLRALAVENIRLKHELYRVQKEGQGASKQVI